MICRVWALCILPLLTTCGSLDGYNLHNDSYNVVSNCADAAQKEGTVIVSFTALFSDDSVSFDDGKQFGMPENHVNVGEGIINMSNDQRTCRGSLTDPGTSEILLLCKNNDDLEADCQIFLSRA